MKKEKVIILASSMSGVERINHIINHWHDTKDYYTQPEGEINDEPSMAVPDQTMSIRELMTRFTQGIPLEGNENPLYDDDNDQQGINPKTLDLVDRQNIQNYTEDIFAKSKEIQPKVDEKKEEKTDEKSAD